MRTRYFGWEYAFKHICQHCGRDGIWNGDGASLGEEFGVTEDEGHETLSDLADRDLLQRVGNSTYIVTRWPERDEAGEEQ
jgi:hypothetical protein